MLKLTEAFTGNPAVVDPIAKKIRVLRSEALRPCLSTGLLWTVRHLRKNTHFAWLRRVYIDERDHES